MNRSVRHKVSWLSFEFSFASSFPGDGGCIRINYTLIFFICFDIVLVGFQIPMRVRLDSNSQHIINIIILIYY